MDTATTATAAAPHVADNDPPPAVPHDPEHDINAPLTVFWLILSTVVVFGSVYLLYVFFSFAIQDERASKIENPTSGYQQVQQLRDLESEALGAGEGRRSIQDAMERLADRK